jgi:DNA-3-methyladenine glycosylase
MYVKLPRNFYERDPLIVSRELLGKFLVRKSIEGEIIGKIVETEAYIGPYDKASHAYNNRKTKRTIVQFGERGHAYIYRIYGIYHCFCIVVGPKYIPAVTLIRAIEPIQGIELIRRNRHLTDEVQITELTNGPSKICQAFRLTTELNGIDLCGEEIFICGGDETSFEVGMSKRIGVNYAEEYKDVPWRFYIKGNKFVSRKPRE